MTNSTDDKITGDHVLDLKGSEQHHDLKNQPGEKGDPDHTGSGKEATGQLKTAIKGASKNDEVETAVGDALKKTVT